MRGGQRGGQIEVAPKQNIKTLKTKEEEIIFLLQACGYKIVQYLYLYRTSLNIIVSYPIKTCCYKQKSHLLL